jgi:hypothetical protein
VFFDVFDMPLDLLFDAGSLALFAFQVVEFCTTYFALFQHFNLVDRGRHDGEDTLNAYAVGDLADGECFTVAVSATALDHRALELLNALLVTFFYFYVNVHSITRLEAGLCLTGFRKFLLYEFNQICHNTMVLKMDCKCMERIET